MCAENHLNLCEICCVSEMVTKEETQDKFSWKYVSQQKLYKCDGSSDSGAFRRSSCSCVTRRLRRVLITR